MTLSIVAKDEKTGNFGVCGYTDIAGYGSLVSHVSLNGAVATQAYVNVDNGIEISELLEKNISISEAGNKVISKDNDKSMRQLIGIGKNNEVFEWTGKNTLDYKNSIIKDNFVVAGNCMESFNVIKSVADCYLSNTNQDFAERLINAIQAGELEGGHIKKINYVDPITKNKITKSTQSIFGKSMSAALIIASKNPQVWHNIRVDAHSNAIFELENIYKKTIESANKLNAFYKGAIEVKPFYWRKILKD